MAYSAYTWKDGSSGATPITATRLNAIELGLAAAANIADSANSGASSAGTLAGNALTAANSASTAAANAAALANSATTVANNALSTASAPLPSLTAPAPSGGDDTAVLMTLINLASSVRGTLMLRSGTYLCNLLIPDNFNSPLIIGQGGAYTVLQAFSASKPVVKFQGGSGGESGGGIRDLCLSAASNSSSGTALVFSGCTTIKARDVIISNSSNGTFAIGVQFLNEQGSDFTEFCTFDGGAITDVRQPVQYTSLTSTESFHGSGLMNSVLINAQGAGPNALPYNAPMSFTAFLASSNWLISNNNTVGGRHASFWGKMQIEGSDTGSQVLGTGTNQTLFQGEITFFNSNAPRLGNIFLVDKIIYTPGSVFPHYLPWATDVNLGLPTTSVGLQLGGSESALVNITIIAANYHRVYTLIAWASPYDSSGSITSIANPYNLDTRGWGPPTFAYANYSLTISNNGFNAPPVGVTAHIGVIPLMGRTNPVLNQ